MTLPRWNVALPDAKHCAPRVQPPSVKLGRPAVASSYYDIMHVSVEQFAYLKCPDKVRAAYINAGGDPVSLDVIKQRLARLPSRVDGFNVGDPTDSDAECFRVAGLVRAVQPRKAITDEERKVIAMLAQGIKDKPVKRRRVSKAKPRVKPAPIVNTDFATALIEQACERTGVAVEEFFSTGRLKHVVAVRSLVVTILRERSETVYSYPRIAKILRKHCHSTIIHAHQQFPHYCDLFPAVADLYAELRETGQ